VSASPFASVELMQQHCQKTMGEIRPTFALFSSDPAFDSHFLLASSAVDYRHFRPLRQSLCRTVPRKTMIRRRLAPCRLWYAICLYEVGDVEQFTRSAHFFLSKDALEVQSRD
jgi:hypothetical protein